MNIKSSYVLTPGIGIVCSDAGASNLIFSFLKHSSDSDFQFYLEGPAIEILKTHNFDNDINDNLESMVKGSKTLITGSGWSSDIENEARKIAKKYGIYSITILDHWVNYKERFVKDDESILPDEIWVVDEYAFKIAQDCFPNTKIELIPNFYLKHQIKNINLINLNEDPELLYVMEPIRSDWGKGIPGEFQAFNFLIENFEHLNLPNDVNIVIRPHPSDKEGKYQELIDNTPEFSIKIDKDRQLFESIGSAHWVAGCETYALVIAIQSGKKVFCCLPPWSPHCRLPHKEIIHLKYLAN